MTSLERLARLERFGIKLGLENMRTLCAALGHPERAFRSVLVAGTNGKGSVTAMVSRALAEAGVRSARFTSPHLVRLAERFVIDEAMIDDRALDETVARVLDTEEQCRRDGRLETPATYFEAATAVAFELFRAARVDLAVLEVGLGGRFDATSVAPAEAGVITGIDLDHTGHLGHTIAAIAREKAGIVKPGTLVVTGERKPEALEVIEDACRARGATLVHADEGVEIDAAVTRGETDLRLRTPVRTYGPVRLALRGAHQIGNAVVAVRLLELLGTRGITVPAGAIETALAATRWPGRLERLALPDGRELLLDGAHNPAGARALAAWIADALPGGRAPLVFAAMADKDVEGMLAALAPVATMLVATELAAHPRCLPAAGVAAVARTAAPGLAVEVETSPRAAVARALAGAETACVAGSLFLVGAVREAFDT